MRFNRLDSVRGIAALSVAAFHVGQSAYLYQGGPTLDQLVHPEAEQDVVMRWAATIYKLFFNGGALSSSVLMFFVLSGFVLTGSLSKKAKPNVYSFAEFMILRIFRIFPAVFFAIIVFVVFYGTTGFSLTAPSNFNVVSVLKNATLLTVSIDGVCWSLQAEWFGTFLIFAMYLATVYSGRWVVIAICAVLAAASMFPGYAKLVTLNGGPSRIAYLHAFAFGAASYHFGKVWWDGADRRVQWSVLIIGLVLFYQATVMITGTLSTTSMREASVAITIQAMAASVIISIIAFGRLDLGVLDWRVVRFYGDISYSFYLLHPLTLTILFSGIVNKGSSVPAMIWSVIDFGIPKPVLAMILTILTVLIITPLAYLSWYFIERPGIFLGKRIVQWGSRYKLPLGAAIQTDSAISP